MGAYSHLYLHIPFCEVICHYCHFYTARSAEADQAAFFHALETDLAVQESLLSTKLDAIYFGGGTPSASPPELIAHLLDKLRDRITPQTEITLEANPTKVSPELAKSWRQSGINRLSLGVQSLNDTLLKRLGRVHSAQEALQALSTARAAFNNVSCDLIYAVPGQTEAEPAEHALTLVREGAGHISAYHLSLEKEHFLYSSLPPDDFAWKQIQGVASALGPLGFRHYELASFTKPGLESRNNWNYWQGGPYLALGPSAHGFNGVRERWSNVSDWREYIQRVKQGESPRAWTEQLSSEQRQIEVIFTSLRTDKGLNLTAFQEAFGVDLVGQKAALFNRWEKEGLGHLAQGHFVLTFQGRMLVDEIAKSLL